MRVREGKRYRPKRMTYKSIRKFSAQFFAPEALWILAGGGTTGIMPKMLL
jgi:hypothetical protein